MLDAILKLKERRAGIPKAAFTPPVAEPPKPPTASPRRPGRPATARDLVARLWTRMGNGVWDLMEIQALFPFRNPKGVAGQLSKARKLGRFRRWPNPEWKPPDRNAIGGWRLPPGRPPRWLYRRAGEAWWSD